MESGVDLDTGSGGVGEASIAGTCETPFGGVREVFSAGFRERGELGAAVCVWYRGQRVVDLWGGCIDQAGERPWTPETAVVVWSATKGAVALCAHILADSGDLDLDSPVGRYWPAFRNGGKRDISVRMLLNHQAGLPGVTETLPVDVLVDSSAMAAQMEREEPLWQPGTRYGYHAATFGWLVGEVVRRVTGQSVGALFRDEVTKQRRLDFWIGLPERERPRLARTVMADMSTFSFCPRFAAALAQGAPIQTAVANSLDGRLAPGQNDDAALSGIEIPSGAGVATARGLAGMYAALTGPSPLVSNQQLMQMAATESAAAREAVYFEPARHSAGFMKSPYACAGLHGGGGPVLSEVAFGHDGTGGAVGFVDVEADIAFGYVTNKHRLAATDPPRNQPLIDVCYQAIGYEFGAAGRWCPARLGPERG